MKRIISILVMACLLVCLAPQSVRAQEEQMEQEEEDKAEAVRKQIVKIVAAYKDESETIYYAKQGSGFVLGVNNSNSEVEKYIISDYGIVEGDNQAIESIRRKYGIAADEKLTPCYFAVGDMGVMTKLEIVSYSNETRYVVMKPDSALADKNNVKLGEGSKIEKNARIYIQGYGGARSIVTDLAVEDRKINEFDTVVTEITTEDYFNDTITYFYVGEVIDEGMAGAPIFDENNCVVGMFVLYNGNMRAISVDNLRIVLDALDIKYMVTEDDASYDIPTLEQKDKLKELIKENKEYISKIKKNRYTAASWNALYTAISQADQVYLDSSATAKQYDDSVTNLKKARKKIKLKVQKFIVMNVIAGVVVCILLFFLIRKLMKKSRIEKQRRRITG